jgi:hypothetical protein
MSTDGFLSPADYFRVTRMLRKLVSHDISGWALAGGFAIELQIMQRGGCTLPRKLNDLDFVAASFDDVPRNLERDFLLRHVHPNDSPGKTLLQMVDAESQLRVDVFRACGAQMERVSLVELPIGRLHIVSFEDMVARATRVCYDLLIEKPVAAKYARDFLRLFELADAEKVEPVWLEHWTQPNAMSFVETARMLRDVIVSRKDLLVDPVYATDVNAICARCCEVDGLHLADPQQIVSLLGYC